MLKNRVKTLYVFNFCSDDVGPMNHATEVLKNTECSIFYLSNTLISGQEKYCFSLCPEVTVFGTFIKIQIFQIVCLFKILFSKEKFDVFLVRQSIGFGVLNLILKLFGKKVLTEVNGLLLQDAIDRKRSPLGIWIVKLFERLTLSCSDAILTVHENIRFNLSQFYGESIIDKCQVVENGVYLEMPSAPDCLSKGLKIGYLGSFAHREGVDFLPGLSKKLAENGVAHEFHIVGGNSNDIDNVTKITIKEGVNQNFRMYGYVGLTEAKAILKKCHMFIHLRRPIEGKTDSQGCPLKTLDYLSIGRCVLATKLESYQFLEDKNLGYLVEYNETFVDGVALSIKHLVDEEKLESFYNKGQLHLESKTWPAQIKKVDRIIADLIR